MAKPNVRALELFKSTDITNEPSALAVYNDFDENIEFNARVKNDVNYFFRIQFPDDMMERIDSPRRLFISSNGISERRIQTNASWHAHGVSMQLEQDYMNLNDCSINFNASRELDDNGTVISIKSKSEKSRRTIRHDGTQIMTKFSIDFAGRNAIEQIPGIDIIGWPFNPTIIIRGSISVVEQKLNDIFPNISLAAIVGKEANIEIFARMIFDKLYEEN